MTTAFDAQPLPRGATSAPTRGLTQDEAETRLERDGFNEPVVRQSQSLLRDILHRLTSPLVAILIVASVGSAALGDIANALVIIVIVALSLAIELVQTRRAARTARALEAAVAPTATVLRDGNWHELPRRDVVLGDVVRIAAGDMVPADARLEDARDLHLNEAALTGESLPVEKAPGDTVAMGCSVVSGSGTAIVTATGSRTGFGAIARTLAARAAPTAFEQGITRFGAMIGKTVLFLVLFVVSAAAVLHKNALEAVLFAVALAVGLTPEFLPMITTVTLARGAMRMAKAKVVVKNLGAIQNFGSIDILCSDKTGTLTTGKMTVVEHVDPFGEAADRTFLLAYINSSFETGVRDPIDVAILEHAQPDLSGHRKLDEIPFDFERRRVSVVAAHEDGVIVSTKGAPEHVLAVSTAYEVGGKVFPLDAAARARCDATIARLSAQGLRAIAVASRSLEPRPSYGKADEHDLVLAGFIALVDPPRDDAHEVVADLRREGIVVKVLSGDSEAVARYVCAKVGISTQTVLTGRDLETMSDPALAHAASKTDVFARVSPAQKNRILRALRARGHVVGFLGDGINDAPSLHAADIGISVANATDVAKDAADVILLESGLRVLYDGVLEGRRAFANVMKYLLMGTSSNFGNMASMAAASVLLSFLPMLPKQILLNSFLYDLAQLTIPYDRVDDEWVQKPRQWDVGLIRRFMIWIGPVSSLYDLLTFWVLLHVFHADPATFRTGWFVESLATQALVIFVIRTGKNPFASRPSGPLAITTLAVIAVGLVLPFTPLATWLGFVPLAPAFFGFVTAVTLTYLGLVELAKRMLFRAGKLTD